MNDSDLAAARALSAGATPGPWEARTGRYDDLHWGDCGPAAGVTVDIAHERGFFVPGFKDADAEFIAASRELVPLLVTEIENRDAEIARLRAEMEADRANAAAVLSDHGWTERFGKWGCDAVESMADALEEAERGSNK